MQVFFHIMSRANDMSGLVAHNLSGLNCRWETTNETDNMATGDQTHEIQRSLWRLA
jgi:hypothetical protein